MTSGPEPVRIETMDHTADVGLRVRAATPREAFVAVAQGMFDVMVDRARVPSRLVRDIRVNAEGWPDLVIAWLEELLYLYETERVVPHHIEIVELTPAYLSARLHGDTLHPGRDEPGVQIKAVTYHRLQAEETRDGFEIQVVFDI